MRCCDCIPKSSNTPRHANVSRFLCSRDSIPHVHKVLSSPSKTPSCCSPSCVRAALRIRALISSSSVLAGSTPFLSVSRTHPVRCAGYDVEDTT
ncbi:uncharacterized protein LAESUDRAFT_76259 [Laetiporus sulphureus 93-53]|uniref:Uncharacterized protein n=1 Tax=Laetiporus sulphureus 93-53 TaxID=1314785 RepID=A0A165F0P3_9APHY|nr:uncharacterized protein LAESUDRAFT_76259 [Laetiporus sulphureus 93-53]KZT08116.1 hypothetical protein LAESUDRAFT_76259 [Laetiporus sulphureus 93-53]